MIFRRKTLQTVVQDEVMRALLLHETRVQDKKDLLLRDGARIITNPEKRIEVLAEQLATERSKNVLLLDEKDSLIREVKGLQQVLLATNQETLRIALVDAVRTVAQEYRERVKETQKEDF